MQLDALRASARTVQDQLRRTATETARLQKAQTTLAALGGVSLVSTLVTRAETLGSVFFPVASLALQVGIALADARNRPVQSEFLQHIRSTSMFTSLRMMLRVGQVQINQAFASASRRRSDCVEWMQMVERVFRFCRALCAGHNEVMRLALHSQGAAAEGGNVDVVEEIARVVRGLVSLLSKSVHYITHPVFCKRLSPLLWEPISPTRRLRFVSWHHADNDFPAITNLMKVTDNINAKLKIRNSATKL